MLLCFALFSVLFYVEGALLKEQEYREQFVQYMQDFEHRFPTAQLEHRYTIFKQKVDHINEVNAQNLSYTLGLNQFSHLTMSERRSMMPPQPREERPLHVTEALVGAYELGDANTNECSSDFLAMSEAQCMAMAETGFTGTTVFGSTYSSPSYPRGCYLYNTDGKIYFNTHSMGASKESAQPICIYRRAYELRITNTNVCSRGYMPMTEHECLAMIPTGFVGNTSFGYSQSYDDYPHGCYLYSDGKVYFNNAFGEKRDDSQPICILHGEIPDSARSSSSVDWVRAGHVVPVKNQGTCGSCWVFGATAVAESWQSITTGRLRAMSEQQVMDCQTFTSNACNGGRQSDALNFIADNGVCQERDYRYQGRQRTCRDNCTRERRPPRSISIWGGTNEMLRAVDRAPISVWVNAEDIFSDYSGGILTNTRCNGEDNGHFVVITGYGTEGGIDYWIARNSWGDRWGENGYIRIQRDRNICWIEYWGVRVL